MQCPACQSALPARQSETRIVETRRAPDGRVRRRRQCDTCGQRFTTYEQIAYENLIVRKRDGTLEPFSRAKIGKSIRKAAVKGLIPKEADFDAFVQRVVDRVEPPAVGEPIDSELIGRMVLTAMEGSDAASLITRIRYAVVFVGRVRGGSGFREPADFLAWLRGTYGDPEPMQSPSRPFEVIKRDGQRKSFDSSKLEKSIGIAAKGMGDDSDVRQFATRVATQVQLDLSPQTLVTTQQVAAEVLKVLRQLDGIVYLRYASAVKRYTSVQDFWLDALSLRRAQHYYGQTTDRLIPERRRA